MIFSYPSSHYMPCLFMPACLPPCLACTGRRSLLSPASCTSCLSMMEHMSSPGWSDWCGGGLEEKTSESRQAGEPISHALPSTTPLALFAASLLSLSSLSLFEIRRNFVPLEEGGGGRALGETVFRELYRHGMAVLLSHLLKNSSFSSLLFLIFLFLPSMDPGGGRGCTSLHMPATPAFPGNLE